MSPLPASPSSRSPVPRVGQTGTPAETHHPADEAAQGRALNAGPGVLMSRAFAYLVDLVILVVITVCLWIGIGLLGIITFGLGWLLLPAVGICAAMAYAAITIGGPKAATPGMRAFGIRVMRADGAAPEALVAAGHCLLFYVASLTLGLAILNVLIGLFRADGRMGHDLLVGFVVVRT